MTRREGGPAPATLGHVLLASLVGGIGLLTGEFVWNVVVSGRDVAASVKAFDRWSPVTTLVLLTLNTFAIGALGAGMAAHLSRAGTRRSALVQASAAVWFLAFFHCALVTTTLGVEPISQFWWSAAWGLIEVPAAIGLGLLTVDRARSGNSDAAEANVP